MRSADHPKRKTPSETSPSYEQSRLGVPGSGDGVFLFWDFLIVESGATTIRVRFLGSLQTRLASSHVSIDDRGEEASASKEPLGDSQPQ